MHSLSFPLFRAFDDENCLCGEKLHTSRGGNRESFDRMRGKYFCSFPHPLLLPPLPSYRCLHPASWSTSLPPSPRLLRFPSFAEFAATTRADSGWKFGFSWHLSSPSGRQTLRRRGRPPCDHRTKQEVKSCLDFSNKKTFCCGGKKRNGKSRNGINPLPKKWRTFRDICFSAPVWEPSDLQMAGKGQIRKKMLGPLKSRPLKSVNRCSGTTCRSKFVQYLAFLTFRSLLIKNVTEIFFQGQTSLSWLTHFWPFHDKNWKEQTLGPTLDTSEGWN